MLEFIILGVTFWLGYQIGQAILSWQLRDLIRKEAIKEGIKVDNEFNIVEDTKNKPNVFQLFVEEANNILYLYDRTDDTFVCQGSSLSELAKLAKEYKNIKYAAVMTDKEIYAFVDGTVKSEQEVLR